MRPQREVLALDLLHHQPPYRVLRGREMPPINTRLIRIITADAKGGEQGTEFHEFRIGKHFPRVRIDRMSQPPLGRCGPNKTPHFIEFGYAAWQDADGTGA